MIEISRYPICWPDKGGDPQKWARLQEAFDQAIGQIAT